MPSKKTQPPESIDENIDLSVFDQALDEYCTECSGTGRDTSLFSDGALWCPFCNGKGTREAQLQKIAKEKEIKEFFEQLNKKYP